MTIGTRSYFAVTISILFGLAALDAIDAKADGYIPAHSLEWPLWNQHTNTERTRIWTSLGEIQARDCLPEEGGSKCNALHSGSDFRGEGGDKVLAVANGNVWYTYRISECNDQNGNSYSCRIYILGKKTDQAGIEEGAAGFDPMGQHHQYVYYYSHLWYGGAAGNTNAVSLNMRNIVENAANRSATGPHLGINGNGVPIEPGTAVAKGDHFASIAHFPSWAHMHFGIYDKLDNYNAVNPITAIKRGNNPDMYDEQKPQITDIMFFPDGIEDLNQVVSPSGGDCNEINRQALDIVADITERFEKENRLDDGSQGDGWWVPADREGETIEVYRANYVVRNVGTGTMEQHEWYRFDRVPFCISTHSWVDCNNFTDENFWLYTVNHPSGAAYPGSDYVNVLFNGNTDMANSYSELPNLPILTNWGAVDRNWNAADTQSYPDGLYQIQVQAFDEAGNSDFENKFVYLNSSGVPCTCNNLPKDAYTRDNAIDIGAVPSETPFWTSPDIVVLYPDAGEPMGRDNPGISSTAIQAGETYNVWVRVHNNLCSVVDDIAVEIMALKPSMILNPSDPAAETEYVTTGYEGELDLGPSGPDMTPTFDYLGPFEWIPQYSGHRCLIAKINSSQDPFGATDNVQYNNNYAQRNVQIEGASNEFRLLNTYQQTANLVLRFDCNTFPINTPGSIVELRVQEHQALLDAWLNVPGTVLTQDSGELVLQFTRCKVEMPVASFPPLLSLPASVNMTLGSGQYGDFMVDFYEYLNDELGGGMSFSISSIQVP